MTKTVTTPRKIVVRKTAAKPAAPKTLYRFTYTPPVGKTLIAYTLGLVVAQIGSIVAGKAVKFWTNLPHHEKRGDLVKVEGQPRTYTLTAKGAAYFADGIAACGQENLDKMVAAIKSGKQPDIWKQPMVEL